MSLRGAADPRRVARVTASVRLCGFSLPIMELTWNLTVCSLTLSRTATPLLGRPSANRRQDFQLPGGQIHWWRRDTRGASIAGDRGVRHKQTLGHSAQSRRENVSAGAPAGGRDPPGAGRTGLDRLGLAGGHCQNRWSAFGEKAKVFDGGGRFPGHVPNHHVGIVNLQRLRQSIAFWTVLSRNLAGNSGSGLLFQERSQTGPVELVK